MSDKSITQRMFIKSGYKVIILNAPEGYIQTMGVIPEQVNIQNNLSPDADIIQYFTKSKADLVENFPLLKQALKDDGSLWITYPKGTSKEETDINRDIIWEIAEKLGFKPVAMISIDTTWAAFRLKKRI